MPFWHDLDNISECHDITLTTLLVGLMATIFILLLKSSLMTWSEVRHDLKCHYCVYMLQNVSNNVYIYVKILFDMIVKNILKWYMVRHTLNRD
jgi:hypothetical protein